MKMTHLNIKDQNEKNEIKIVESQRTGTTFLRLHFAFSFDY